MTATEISKNYSHVGMAMFKDGVLVNRLKGMHTTEEIAKKTLDCLKKN